MQNPNIFGIELVMWKHVYYRTKGNSILIELKMYLKLYITSRIMIVEEP